MDKFTPQIAYRLEVPRNDPSQTEIKFTAQPNFIAGIRIGELNMPLTPPQKNNMVNVFNIFIRTEPTFIFL